MANIYGGFSPVAGQTLGRLDFSIGPYTFNYQILHMNLVGSKRDAVEVTNMWVPPVANGFGNKLFIPDAFMDGGELHLKVLHDPTIGAVPIINATPTTLVIHWGPAATVQQTFTFLGFMTKFEVAGPLDGAPMTDEIIFKVTGVVGSNYTDWQSTNGAVQVTANS